MERKHYYLTLVFVLVAICAAGVMAQSCEPDCGGKNPFDKVPDPRNCSQYFMCIGDGLPSDKPLPCPDGEQFDSTPEVMDCGPPGGICDDSCLGNACHLYCNASLDIVAEPKNCSLYYICLPGGVKSDAYSCPADRPVFDGTDCVLDKSKCCDSNDLCQPVCEPGVVQAPDPIDCHKFYICVDGVISEDYHFDCDSGEYFDIQAGHCIPETTPCVNLCDAGTGGGGSTPGVEVTTTPGDVVVTTTTTKVTTTPKGTTTIAATTTTEPKITTTTATTTAKPEITTTTATTTAKPEITTTTDCAASLTCTGAGYFAMCHTCQPFYYQCDANDGSTGILMRCSGDLVFNPDPEYPYCILETNCPYSP